jgi:hypothetical protein
VEERYGARRNIRLGTIDSLDALALRHRYDLVLCVGMLNYLTPAELRAGLAQLYRRAEGLVPTLTVSSDVSSAEPASQAPVGTVQNTTTVNGVVIDSLAIGINSTVEAEQQGTAANTPSGYTLSSTVTLTGAASGTSGLAISASSAALAPEAADIIPEPATMVVWGFGAIGLLWTARRRLARSAA